MANPLKGEVRFTGSDGVSRTLSYSAEAIYRLELQLGKTVNEIAGEMQDAKKFGMGLIRPLFWAGLLDTHEGLEFADVGPIFAKVAMLESIHLVTEAFNGAFVDPRTPAVPADPPQPSQDAAGTGSAS